MEIDKLDIKSLVQGRRKQGVEWDSAISEEKNTPKDGYGRIYKLYSSECNEEYIGLTTLTLDERFKKHIISVRKGSSMLIHKAMRRYGVKSFSISLIEGCVPVSELSEREIHYIKDFNTRAPHGLNKSAGGQLGGCRGISSEVNGVEYKSLTEAGKAIETETKGAVRWFTAERRIRNHEDIYAHTRKNSPHADAGTNLFSRYLGLEKRKQLCRRWLNYDLFKKDVLKEFTMMQIINQKLRLGKISGSKLYGPKSFLWFTPKEAIEARCGKPINAFGQSFPSITACSVYFDMPVSTLKYRIRILKLTPEQAVETI
jgi:group I intron endonuclease